VIATPAEYPVYIYNDLYTNETGEEVGLDEVQLLDPIPVKRIPRLIVLLGNDDLYMAYQSGLILAAWGIKEGVAYFQHFIDARIDKNVTFERHRLWGLDNVYDVIAEALGIAILVDYNRVEVISMLRDILKLYGECYFESKLKGVLLNLDEQSLLPDIKLAMQLALQHERYYQASQLLPILAKYDGVYASTQVDTFRNLVGQDERIQCNLEEVQALLP
jgi:hypothetical protein